MSEDLAEYYSEVRRECRYMHSEIETLERGEKSCAICAKVNSDVLIGINLAGEGLVSPRFPSLQFSTR